MKGSGVDDIRADVRNFSVREGCFRFEILLSFYVDVYNLK